MTLIAPHNFNLTAASPKFHLSFTQISNQFKSICKNTIVHRVSNYMVQFGDVEYKDGDGGVSSFKKKYFADENFDVGTQPRKRGWL